MEATSRLAPPARSVRNVYVPAMLAPKLTRSAAFYDVDGTLIKTNIVHAFAWYAAHQPTLLG